MNLYDRIEYAAVQPTPPSLPSLEELVHFINANSNEYRACFEIVSEPVTHSSGYLREKLFGRGLKQVKGPTYSTWEKAHKFTIWRLTPNGEEVEYMVWDTKRDHLDRDIPEISQWIRDNIGRR